MNKSLNEFDNRMLQKHLSLTSRYDKDFRKGTLIEKADYLHKYFQIEIDRTKEIIDLSHIYGKSSIIVKVKKDMEEIIKSLKWVYDYVTEISKQKEDFHSLYRLWIICEEYILHKAKK